MLLKLGVHSGTEAAPPGPSFPHILHDAIGMRARFTSMGGLVVLVECVRSPKTLVAIGTGVFPPSLMEFFFVSFPVEFALERLVA